MRPKDYGRNRTKRKEYIQADFYELELMGTRRNMMHGKN